MRVYRLSLLCLTALKLCSCAPEGDTAKTVPQREKKNASLTNTVSVPDSTTVTNDASNPYAGIPDNQPVIHRVRAGEPDGDGWCLAKSTRGNFSVMLPGQYMDSMLKMPTTKGGTGVMHTVATKSPDGIEFNVLFSEIIGEMPDEDPLDGMTDRFKQLGATMTRTNIVLAGLPAVRMKVLVQGTAAEIIHVDATTAITCWPHRHVHHSRTIPGWKPTSNDFCVPSRS